MINEQISATNYCIFVRIGKTTAIRRIAVRENSLSRHYLDPYEVPLKHLGPSQHYRIEGFTGGPLIGPPLCRETQVSRAADVIFCSLVSWVEFFLIFYEVKILFIG